MDHVYLGGTSDGDVAYWNVDYLEYENGHRFVVGSLAQLNVVGKGRTSDNLALQLYSGGKQTLEIGTTDHYDATIPRTVTFEGGVGANIGLTDAKLVVDGIGTFVFNTVTSGHRFNSPITVKDTATLALKDTAVSPLGALNLNSGTTLKVVQTSPTGIVELGKAESAKLFAASAGKSGDYTHPIPAGADAFARLFIKNVKDRGLEVAALFT